MSAAVDIITEGEKRIFIDLVNKLDALGSDNLDTLSEGENLNQTCQTLR